MYDYLICGAGLAGAVMAERLASISGMKILLIDKRNHIGGNTYDHYNEDGILVHRYGPHIFHTNSKDIFDYLGKFTSWRSYEHHVLASVDGQFLPIPINQNTINGLYGLQLNSMQMKEFYESVAEKKEFIQNAEDVVLNTIGRELYEKFFKTYTRKQWDLDPVQLDASVTARIPIRTNRDNRYFTDVYQAMPEHGYTAMVNKMIDHPNIHLMLNTDFNDVKDEVDFKALIYTGPIDAYFGYCYGQLPYRSIRFQHKTIDREYFQAVGTVNYPTTQDYTRITEYKHLTGQCHRKTSIVYEFPTADGDPYYPIPTSENQKKYDQYKALASTTKNTWFTGRLGTYKYYNMDQVVAQSLTLFKKLVPTHAARRNQLHQHN